MFCKLNVNLMDWSLVYGYGDMPMANPSANFHEKRCNTFSDILATGKQRWWKHKHGNEICRMQEKKAQNRIKLHGNNWTQRAYTWWCILNSGNEGIMTLIYHRKLILEATINQECHACSMSIRVFWTMWDNPMWLRELY